MLAPPLGHRFPSPAPHPPLGPENSVSLTCSLFGRSVPHSPASPRSPLDLLQPRCRPPPSRPPALSTRPHASRASQPFPLPDPAHSSPVLSDTQPLVADNPSPSLPSNGSPSLPSPASPTTPPSAEMSVPLNHQTSRQSTSEAPCPQHAASASPCAPPRPDLPALSPSSDHRHSSMYASHAYHYRHHQSTSSTKAAPLPFAGDEFATVKSISSLAVAAAGDTLRSTCLDESALSPGEYAAYVPMLLSLDPAPSGLDGLYDELSALEYLRNKCKLHLRDEALILSLFERTPLGIKPGHFYAWLRLVSWVQQGRRPSKELLFTQCMFLPRPSKLFSLHTNVVLMQPPLPRHLSVRRTLPAMRIRPPQPARRCKAPR